MNPEQGDLFSDVPEEPKAGPKPAANGTPRKPAASAPAGVGVVDVDLHEITRSRFLNYAVSVITSRALPDVRDGLKPVQRRILYTMHHDLHLSPDKPTLKCAKVVGQVLGNYHPHGDSAVYDALVRMAQPWSMRYPLVFGQGNFGSLDGDSPAAYRYTEAKLTAVAMEFVSELAQQTVDYRRTFDDQHDEPVVLPARVPQLLINGCTGIAVGVATNIPPHNLREVVEAGQALIDNRELTTEELLKIIKGPDFPTGGEILEDRASLVRVYSEGQGRIRVRGQHQLEEDPRRGPLIVVTSIPYMVNKSSLVEEIAELIVGRKIPQLLDVRDESTEDVRIVMEIKKDADPAAIMAYLHKNTALQSSFHVNMTCLVPTADGVGAPERLSLSAALLHFIDFRHQVTVRRLTYDLKLITERLHVLDGFNRVFDGLDEALDIIRTSDGRADAAAKLMARFSLDQVQADAVLDLRLYRLGRPDIQAIRKEQLEKEVARQNLQELLDSPRRLWELVKVELGQVKESFADSRRTKILVGGADQLEYSEEAFIVAEEAVLLLSRDGWVRRVSTGTDLAKVRLRTDDEVLAVVRGSTLSTLVFLSSHGVAYTTRFNDIPMASRGFGDPIQKFFSFSDGERVVAAYSLDPEVTPGLRGSQEVVEGAEPVPPPTHALAITSEGRGLRFSLEPYLEASTRAGRKYARPSKGAEVMAAFLTHGSEATVIAVSRQGRALLCPVEEVNFLAGPGKGVTVIKLGEGDVVIGACLSESPEQGITVVRTDGGKEIPVNPGAYEVVSRGGRGKPIIKRGQLTLAASPPLQPTDSEERQA